MGPPNLPTPHHISFSSCPKFKTTPVHLTRPSRKRHRPKVLALTTHQATLPCILPLTLLWSTMPATLPSASPVVSTTRLPTTSSPATKSLLPPTRLRALLTSVAHPPPTFLPSTRHKPTASIV